MRFGLTPKLRHKNEAHSLARRTSVSNTKTGTKTRWQRDFKLRALSRMEEAMDVTALAAELGCRRELLYKWRRKYRSGGAGVTGEKTGYQRVCLIPCLTDGVRSSFYLYSFVFICD